MNRLPIAHTLIQLPACSLITASHMLAGVNSLMKFISPPAFIFLGLEINWGARFGPHFGELITVVNA